MRKLRGRLTPDFATVADFRRDNGKPIRAIFHEFTMVCRRLELYGGAWIAIDGSKFKAFNSRDRYFTRRKVERLKRRADEKIKRYLEELDEADEQEQYCEKPTAEDLQEKIDWLKGSKVVYAEMEKKMDESGDGQVSLTDPDAWSMWLGWSRGTEVA